MFQRNCHYILILLQIFCLQSSAQIVTNVTQYSTADGLSDDRISDIIKDREGFMWFSSWAGITRFDGFNFLTFKSFPGDRSRLKSNRIDEIVEDSEGQYLWLRAYDKQVYRFDKGKQEFTPLFELLGDHRVQNISFSKIISAKNNRVWLQTEGKGVFLLSNSKAKRPELAVFSNAAGARYNLPSNDLHFFHEDTQGKVWIGTSKGLRVFNTIAGRFRKIQTSMDQHAYVQIAEAKHGVWLLGKNGTLTFLSNSFNELKTHRFTVSKINHIFVSRQNILYCTTAAGELLSVEKDGTERLLKVTRTPSPLFSIHEDRLGHLWIESKRFGVIRYSPETKKTEHPYPEGDYVRNNDFPPMMIFEDNKSIVWINLNNRLSYYDDNRKTMQPLYAESARSGFELPKETIRTYYDESGVLWLSSGYEGVNKVVFREHKFLKHIPKPGSSERSDNEVRGIFSDRFERLWIGTKEGALYVYKNGVALPNFLLSVPVKKPGIYFITEDKRGRIWCGTKSDGLIMAEPIDKDATKYAVKHFLSNRLDPETLSSNSIYCLMQDRKGRLWAGSYGEGLILIEEKNGKTVFKSTKNSFRNYPEGFKRIRYLAEDYSGRVWIGTTNGLLIFDPDSSSPENYKFHQFIKEPGNINSLGGSDIQFIYRDSKNRMWVLTTTGGLNLANKVSQINELSFINYSVKNGLPSDFLLSCTEDKNGNLWIATQNGLSKFSLDNKSFENFNANDGLPDGFSEAAVSRTEQGMIFFGTNKGYISYDPGTIRRRKISAPLQFTNFQVNSQDLLPAEGSSLSYAVNNTQNVSLDYDQNVISIDFAVLDFHSFQKQMFACRLVGFDNVWRNTEGQRRATYTKLPPGDYVFEVKSLNDELYSELPVRSLKITIRPPLWRTWWAYTLYLMLAAGFIFLIRRIVITVLQLRQRVEIEKQVAEMKLSFFTQISHELRTPLTLIVNPSEEIMEHETLSNKGKEYIKVVVKNTRRMLRLVNQILDLRKLESGKASLKLEEVEILSFIKNLTGYFEESVRSKNLDIKVISNINHLNAEVDSEKLEIVLYNLLDNAIKFSADSGEICIVVYRSENSNSFTIEVADKGPGVRDEELEEIFSLYYEGTYTSGKQAKGTGIGLALAKELVELHGGEIYARHNIPQGLRVIVGLNLPKELFISEKPSPAEVVWRKDLTQQTTQALPYSSGHDHSGVSAELPLLLIVEDNDDLRQFLTDKFSGSYRVTTARDGVEGLEMAKAQLPELVLSDIMMPRMDGIEMLNQIKNSEETSHIPVIMLTARYSVESQVSGLRYGADYYITKPFDLHVLQAAVENIIKQRQKVFQSLLRKEDKGQSSGSGITDNDRLFLEKILNIVEGKLNDTQFNIDHVADSVGMSRSVFYRKFKSLTATSPVEFVRDVRLKKAKELLDAGNDNISTIAYSVGFSNPKYFSACFKAKYQQNPSDYVKSIR